MDAELEQFRRYSYKQSRIPALDALEVFVPTGQENDDVIKEVTSRTGSSRWFPVSGGHRVLILYEGGGYDSRRFTLIKGAWDHEHCTRCRDQIKPMTLCWVTEIVPCIILCEECHRLIISPDAA
jgi:hypothetical protein